MTAGLLLLAVAAGLLAAGAELFAEHVTGAAQRLGLSVLAVGVLLAGAEPEELVTALTAALRDRPELAVGDAVGANVTILTAALGLAALARPLPVGRRTRAYAGAAAVAGAFAALALLDGRVGRVEGVGLLGAYVVFVAVVWRWERRPPAIGELAELAELADTDDPEPGGVRPTRALLLAVAGLAVMALGGDLAVDGAVRVASALGGADAAVGLTLLALATTAELFALVAAAARRGLAEVAVAGVVGSVVCNATVTLGAAALVAPLHARLVGPAAVAAVLPLVVVGLARGGILGRPAGALLALGYPVYVAAVLASA